MEQFGLQMQLYWNPSSIELITIDVQLAGFLSEHCSDHAGLQFRDARQCCVLLHVCTVAKKIANQHITLR